MALTNTLLTSSSRSQSASATTASVTLSWTAPALSTGTSPVAAYDLRYTPYGQEDADFTTWTPALSQPAPAAPGRQKLLSLLRKIRKGFARLKGMNDRAQRYIHINVGAIPPVPVLALAVGAPVAGPVGVISQVEQGA